MSTTPMKSSLDSKYEAPIGARLGGGTDEFVLIHRDLLAVGLDRGKTRDLMSNAAQTAIDNKPLPRTIASGGSVLEGTELKSSNLAVSNGVRTVMRGLGKRKRKTDSVKIRLCKYVNLSASALPVTTVIPIEPSSTSEWSAIAALFDEVKVTGADLHYQLNQATSPIGMALAVVAYDPLTATALGGVVNGCEFRQHQLIAAGDGNAGSSVSPAPVNPAGLHQFTCRIPKGSARSTSSTATFGDEWSATADASDIFGWIKPYIESSGIGTNYLTGMLYLHCEFRSRS
jgi:hypothetical protein